MATASLDARLWSQGNAELIKAADYDGPEFERALVKCDLRLDEPHMWPASHKLKAWVERWKNRRYVPEWLLDHWGLDADELMTDEWHT